jgi:hypothetical protein
MEHETLAAALAAFQAEVPKMSKDETAKVTGKNGETGAPVKYTYGYAGLDQFVEIVEPVLGKHGLSVTSAPCWEDGRFVLVVTLLHEGGDERNGYWPLPDPSVRGVGPQDIGSAMTYGRRYVGWGLTGTFPGGIDDDGKQAQQAARDSWETAQPARRPVEDRQAQAGEEPQAAPAKAAPAPKTSWTDEEVAAYTMKLADPSVSLELTAKGYDWMASHDLHTRPLGPSGKTATLVLALRLADQALTPEATLLELGDIKTVAEGRGLMNVKVSATETLEQVLHEAHELAAHAADTAEISASLAEEQGD